MLVMQTITYVGSPLMSQTSMIGTPVARVATALGVGQDTISRLE